MVRWWMHAVWVGVVFVAAVVGAAGVDSREEVLGYVKKELEAEKHRVSLERKRWEEELKKWEERRNVLSDKMVELRMTVARKKREVERLRKQRETLRAEVGSLQREWEEVTGVLKEAEVFVKDFLSVVPPLNRDGSKAKVGWGDALEPFLETLLSLLGKGNEVECFDRIVLTPRGVKERVEVVRVGQIGWGYRSCDSSEVALAVRAPAGEKGWRWMKVRSPSLCRSVERLLDAVRAGRKETILFPVDVTGEISLDSRTRLRSLWDVLQSGGLVMVPLAGVALMAAMLILERLLFLLREGRRTAPLAMKVLALVADGRMEDAEELCFSGRNVVLRVMGACLRKRDAGGEEVENAAREAILHELPRLERFLPTLGVLAGVAPLLGLLGTVTGMILTFDMISAFGSGNARMMAGGISQALVTTAAGLVIAIPVLLMHSFLSTRIDLIIADAERFAASLLNVLAEGKKEGR